MLASAAGVMPTAPKKPHTPPQIFNLPQITEVHPALLQPVLAQSVEPWIHGCTERPPRISTSRERGGSPGLLFPPGLVPKPPESPPFDIPPRAPIFSPFKAGAKLQTEVIPSLLRSALAQSAKPNRSSRDKQPLNKREKSPPPWDKRHHVIPPFQKNRRRRPQKLAPIQRSNQDLAAVESHQQPSERNQDLSESPEALIGESNPKREDPDKTLVEESHSPVRSSSKESIQSSSSQDKGESKLKLLSSEGREKPHHANSEPVPWDHHHHHSFKPLQVGLEVEQTETLRGERERALSMVIRNSVVGQIAGNFVHGIEKVADKDKRQEAKQRRESKRQSLREEEARSRSASKEVSSPAPDDVPADLVEETSSVNGASSANRVSSPSTIISQSESSSKAQSCTQESWGLEDIELQLGDELVSRAMENASDLESQVLADQEECEDNTSTADKEDSSPPPGTPDSPPGLKSSNKQRLYLARRGKNQNQDADAETTSGRPKSFSEHFEFSTAVVPFTEEERSVLWEFFDLHDADSSGSLSLEELVSVVDDIGRAPPEGSEDAAHFESLMRHADKDRSGELSFEEFTTFLATYYQSVYQRLFLENDEDGSGTISTFELKGLMVKLRESGFKLRGEDVADLFSSIDQGGDSILDWNEFMGFMIGYRKLEFQLLATSAGFRATELDYLQTIFEQADEDKSGQLGIKEVVEIVERTMLADKVQSEDEIEKIIEIFARIDKNKSRTLDFLEFLRLLRVWSNRCKGGRQDILKLFKDADAHASKVIDSRRHTRRGSNAVTRRIQSTVTSLCSSLVDGENEKFIADMRDLAVQNDVEDGVLSKQFGLTIQEVRSLRDTFEFCDVDGSGHIDRQELEVILRNLGFVAVSGCQKRAFAETLDRDEFKGPLAFEFLVQFLCDYQIACADKAILAMKAPDDEGDGIPTKKLGQALYQLGLYLHTDGVMEWLEKIGGDPDSPVVSRETLLKIIDILRRDKIYEWRKKCGFSSTQLDAIKFAFNSYCTQEDCLSVADGALLDALRLLNLSPPPESRQKLLMSVLRVDRKCEGTITFPDFLLLVRSLENQKVHARTELENEKAKLYGMDNDTVQQFRDVFMECEPNQNCQVEIPKINRLFVDLGLIKDGRQRMQLLDVIHEVTGSDKGVLDFAQFLDVLNRLEKKGILKQ